jgi:hypothetical protein
VGIYGDLILSAPGLKQDDLLRLYKDASIATPATHERVEHPRAGVTISRGAFGVPHIVGDTRGDVFFGAGYATAEDRLFLTDVFRHVGRGRLSEFLGGILGMDATLSMDRGMYAVAGYSEAELQQQVDAFPMAFPMFAADLTNDITEFTAHSLAEPADVPAGGTVAARTPRCLRQSPFGVIIAAKWLLAAL